MKLCYFTYATSFCLLLLWWWWFSFHTTNFRCSYVSKVNFWICVLLEFIEWIYLTTFINIGILKPTDIQKAFQQIKSYINKMYLLLIKCYGLLSVKIQDPFKAILISGRHLWQECSARILNFICIFNVQ